MSDNDESIEEESIDEVIEKEKEKSKDKDRKGFIASSSDAPDFKKFYLDRLLFKGKIFVFRLYIYSLFGKGG